MEGAAEKNFSVEKVKNDIKLKEVETPKSPKENNISSADISRDSSEFIESISKLTDNENANGMKGLFDGIRSLFTQGLTSDATQKFFLFFNDMTVNKKKFTNSYSCSLYENVSEKQCTKDIEFFRLKLSESGLNTSQRSAILRNISTLKDQYYIKKNKKGEKSEGILGLSKEDQERILFDEIGKIGPGCILNFSSNKNEGLQGQAKTFVNRMIGISSGNSVFESDHTAIVSRVENGEIYIIESDKKHGVHEAKLSTYLEDNNYESSRVCVMNTKTTKEQNNNIVKEVSSHIGKGYDMGGAIGDRLYDKSNNNDKKYCSELIIDAIREVIGESLTGVKTPSELTNYSQMFIPQYIGKMGGDKFMEPYKIQNV